MINRLLQAKSATSRRYANFEKMFKTVFVEREWLYKFYSYGCYCLNIGDRPLTGILNGFKPHDKVDE